MCAIAHGSDNMLCFSLSPGWPAAGAAATPEACRAACWACRAWGGGGEAEAESGGGVGLGGGGRGRVRGA